MTLRAASYGTNSAAGNVNLVFLQRLHYQHVIFPELSDQLALVRRPSEEDLACNKVKNSPKKNTTVSILNSKQKTMPLLNGGNVFFSFFLEMFFQSVFCIYTYLV